MKIGILKKGDKVLTITAEFIAVQRKNGEVDIIPTLPALCAFVCADDLFFAIA